MQSEQTQPDIYFEIGEKYLIRTVTNYLTGQVVKMSQDGLVLAKAAWIADTGRFSNAIAEGKLNEVEPVTCQVFVNRSAIVDAFKWGHPLPREQK